MTRRVTSATRPDECKSRVKLLDTRQRFDCNLGFKMLLTDCSRGTESKCTRRFKNNIPSKQ